MIGPEESYLMLGGVPGISLHFCDLMQESYIFISQSWLTDIIFGCSIDVRSALQPLILTVV